MKLSSAIVKQAVNDGASFFLVIALVMGGLWGLTLVDASIYAMTIYSALLAPALLSTGAKFGQDMKDTASRFIA